jgi:NAD(P)-dependent dehydrogenase (short-subunit alcohol dehydrogenase family)
MTAELADKVAIVSGVGPGLGREVAERFAAEGAAVVLAARNRDLLDEVAAVIDKAGGRAITVPTDITDAVQNARLLDTTLTELGRVDVLVNNAFAFGKRELLTDIEMDEWRLPLEVNLIGTMRLSVATAKAMATQGGGSIVMVNSQAMRRNESRRGPYSASKAALLSASQTLAGEFGRHNVRVNSVVPAQIWGEMLERHFAGMAERKGITPEEMYEQVARGIPIRRIVTAAEVAEAVLFFASDRSSAITGQSLDVNGGSWFH